jgi:hypothetical protein
MKVYTVHEPCGPDAGPYRTAAADRVDRAETFRFVSDGFDWSAALFAPFVLLGHRMFAALALYAAALVAIVSILSAVGADGAWIALAIGALHVAVGFEFGELLRAKLDADGWAERGTVSGRTLAECERRFFQDWLPRQPLISGLRTASEVAPQGGELPGVSRGAGWRGRLPWQR